MSSVSENNAEKTPKRISVDFKTLGPALALLLLCVIGFLLNPAFVSEGNLTNLLTRSAFIGIIAVGATFVITAGGIDLSVGSMAAAISGVMIIVMVPEVLKFTFGMVAGGAAEVAQLRAPVQEIVFGLLIIFFLMFEPLGINQLVDRGIRALNRWPFARG